MTPYRTCRMKLASPGSGCGRGRGRGGVSLAGAGGGSVSLARPRSSRARDPGAGCAVARNSGCEHFRMRTGVRRARRMPGVSGVDMADFEEESIILHGPWGADDPRGCGLTPGGGRGAAC